MRKTITAMILVSITIVPILYAAANSQVSQHVENAVNQSTRLQQQQKDMSSTDSPFAPLHSVIQQGVTFPNNTTMPTQMPAMQQQPSAPTVSQPLPARQSHKSAPKNTKQPTTSDHGISGLSDQDSSSDDDGVKLNF